MAGENPKFSDKKIIGVDLDGVVCNLWDPFRQQVLMRTGIDLPRDIPAYNPEECSKLTREQMENIFREGRTMYMNLPEIARAKSALRSLKNRYRIHIITHRDFYKGIQKDTLRWLKKHGIPYDKITFTGLDKTREVLDAGCGYMIEDCGEVAIKLAKKRQKVILLDRSYNKSFNHRLISRVKSWDEIISMLGLDNSPDMW